MYMRKTLIFCLLLLVLPAVTYASCLSAEDIDTLNLLANTTNISNSSVINIFERLCNTTNYTANITYLNNVTANLSTMLNSTNSSTYLYIYNMTEGSFTNLSSEFNGIINETVDREVSESYETESQQLLDSYRTEFNDQLNAIRKNQDAAMTAIWNSTATQAELNETRQYMENRMSALYNQFDLRVSQMLFWIGIPALAALLIFGYLKFVRQKYPISKDIKTLINLQGQRKIPQTMQDDDEMTVKDNIGKMRTFILGQNEFSGTTRKAVYQKYLNGEITTEEEALEEMRMAELDKVKPHGKK